MFWVSRLKLIPALLLAAPLLSAPLLYAAQAATPPDQSSSIHKAISLAQSGQCQQALPILHREIRLVKESEAKKKAGLAGVRCAMTLGQSVSAIEFLEVLVHDFPHDPDILYSEVHAFSDLSTRASQELATSAPSSPQAHELLAESYESQGKWKEAEKEYRAILASNPDTPGIHFRLGRYLLSHPNPSADVAAQAKQEFQEELKIDPSNAGAEYVLGELDRQSQQWEEAVNHFSRAAKLDSRFGEAYLGLGMSLLSEKKYADALPPLETAVKLEPRNPDAHYNLAIAYTRAGRKEDGEKEFSIHKRLIGNDGGAQPQPNGKDN